MNIHKNIQTPNPTKPPMQIHVIVSRFPILLSFHLFFFQQQRQISLIYPAANKSYTHTTTQVVPLLNIVVVYRDRERSREREERDGESNRETKSFAPPPSSCFFCFLTRTSRIFSFCKYLFLFSRFFYNYL